MNKVENAMVNNLSDIFEEILLGALNKEENKDIDLVSYTELLIDIPNCLVNNVIYNIVNKYSSKYGIDIFNKKLRDVIKSGVYKISMVEDISIDELYDKVYKYYLSI